MAKQFNISEEALGYVTALEASNLDKRYLTSGSKNVLIDFQKKVKTRAGYTRLGAENTALTPIRNAWTWNTSTGTKLAQRFYDDELEVYLGTIDTYVINAWTRVKSGWSTTEMLRSCIRQGGNGGWWNATESKDEQIMVNGTDKLWKWNGAVAVVASITGTTITKQGTTTFAQNRFYAAGNKVVVCVRTGTAYTYTGGETTTQLTGIADTAGLQANDILVQQVVETDNKPDDGRNNHYIYNFQNQIALGSDDDPKIFISQSDDYTDFSKSSPRVVGEGETWILDNPTKGIAEQGGYLIVFSGNSSFYKGKPETFAVGTTITQKFDPEKIDTGVGQGALNQESIVPIGNAIAYISNEPALRIIENPEDLTGINPKTFSNPIQPDFDAEDWDKVFGTWYKNILIYSTPDTSHTYMLNFVQDADGKLFRFWNPPQILPVGAMSLIDLDDGKGIQLYGHSNSVPESYLLFDGASDGQYEDMDVANKLPISAKAVFAYNNYKDRTNLKNFDEYYVEGEITPNSKITLTIDYDYNGVTQSIEKEIDGSDDEILEGTVDFNSLAQQSLAINPLGGFLNAPSNTRKFRTIFEQAKEDFYEIRATFESEDVDQFWAIIAHGSNAQMSNRLSISIKRN